MRKSTIILSLALIAVLSMGAVTTYNFYAPLVPGSNGQLLTSAGANGNPTWLASGTAGQVLVSGGPGVEPSWSGFSRAEATKESGVSGSVIIHKCGKLCIAYIGGLIVPGDTSTVTKNVATTPSGYGSSEFICAAIMTNYGGNPSIISINGNTLKVWGATPTKVYYGTLVYYTP